MSSNGFDLELPSIRQVQTLIRDKKAVEVKVTTGDTLVGTIGWQDANAIGIRDDQGQSTILMRGAIAYLKTSA